MCDGGQTWGSDNHRSKGGNAVQNYSDFGLCKSENLHQVLLLTFVDLHCRSVEMSMVRPTRPTSLSKT